MRTTWWNRALDHVWGWILGEVQELTDDQIRSLCARLRAGEPSARDEMFLYVSERLRPLASKILRIDFPRVGLVAETDDVLHDVLCKLIPYLEKGGEQFCTGTGPFHALTALIVRRTLISLARKYYGTLQARPIGEELEAAHPGFQKSSGLDALRDRLRIHELVERLPERERAVIELAMYLNFDTAQIGACLGVSSGHAARLLATAKEALGKLLDEDDQRAGG
jgi:RNA polymerase sigma factor (sigma-70 family)